MFILTILTFFLPLHNVNADTVDSIGDYWKVTTETKEVTIFKINLKEENVLVMYADTLNGKLFLQATVDGVAYSGQEIERVVAWDEMGRMDNEVLLTPGLFDLNDLIAFYATNTEYQIDFKDGTFINHIPNDTNKSPEVLSKFYHLLKTLKFSY